MEFALHLVEDVDRAGIGVGELHRLGDDGGEHGLEIERRVHRLRDFAERAQFADRAAKLVGALAQFAEQPRILDGDDGLRGEVGDQRDLLVGKRTDFLAVQGERTDQFVLLQHRDGHERPHAAKLDGCDGRRIASFNIARSMP